MYTLIIYVYILKLEVFSCLLSIPYFLIVDNNVMKKNGDSCAWMISQNYYSSDCSSGIMGEKARSTAEEFKRQAKEKAESVSEGAKVEAWEGSKESTVSSSNSSDKDKLKETVEKGNYDKINGKE